LKTSCIIGKNFACDPPNRLRSLSVRSRTLDHVAQVADPQADSTGEIKSAGFPEEQVRYRTPWESSFLSEGGGVNPVAGHALDVEAVEGRGRAQNARHREVVPGDPLRDYRAAERYTFRDSSSPGLSLTAQAGPAAMSPASSRCPRLSSTQPNASRSSPPNFRKLATGARNPFTEGVRVAAR